MVIYSETAKLDLIDTLYGLITWEKHTITIEHAERYVDDILSTLLIPFAPKHFTETAHTLHIYNSGIKFSPTNAIATQLGILSTIGIK